MASRTHRAFAIWITGLPASGKSTLAAAVKTQLASRGVDAAVLESDELRKVFTPEPRYDEKERGIFYGQMVYIGALPQPMECRFFSMRLQIAAPIVNLPGSRSRDFWKYMLTRHSKHV